MESGQRLMNISCLKEEGTLKKKSLIHLDTILQITVKFLIAKDEGLKRSINMMVMRE